MHGKGIAGDLKKIEKKRLATKKQTRLFLEHHGKNSTTYKHLNSQPHSKGGYYAEIYRSKETLRTGRTGNAAKGIYPTRCFDTRTYTGIKS